MHLHALRRGPDELVYLSWKNLTAVTLAKACLSDAAREHGRRLAGNKSLKELVEEANRFQLDINRLSRKTKVIPGSTNWIRISPKIFNVVSLSMSFIDL